MALDAATAAEPGDLYPRLRGDVEQIIAHYKTLYADGKIDISEGWELFQDALQSFMRLAEELKGYDGSAKKSAVLQAIETFYDEVIAPMDIPKVPNVIEKTIVDPMIKRSLLAMASGAIDSIAKLLNNTGWFATPGSNGAKPNYNAQPEESPALRYVL